MTLINALESLKEKGIKRMVGSGGEPDIDRYIQHVKDRDQLARDVLKSYPNMDWARYQIEHEDDYFIIEINGHYIIVSINENSLKPGTTFNMATYGSEYETEEEMQGDFDEWSLQHEAEKIADQMMKERPGFLSRPGWVLIAKNELKKSREEAHATFLKEFPD